MKINFNRESRVESRGQKTRLGSSSGSRRPPPAARPLLAFTLLEVMIATAIFFMAMFSILALVSQSLRQAHALTKNGPTVGMVAAYLSNTNKLDEGTQSGTFEDIAMGLYPDYDWTSETYFYPSNGIFRMDIGVYHGGNLDSSMSILLYKPDSATGLSTRSVFSR